MLPVCEAFPDPMTKEELQSGFWDRKCWKNNSTALGEFLSMINSSLGQGKPVGYII